MLLDLDGTLVDSTRIVVAGWEQFALRNGLRHEEVLAYSHGRPAGDIVRHFIPGAAADAELALQVAYEESHLEGIMPVPGAPQLLARLRGQPWAVVTSGWRRLAEARWRAAGLGAPPLLVPADELARGKPDPEGYLRAARALGVAPGDCVVIEDAPAGLEAARRAGMRAVGLLTTTPADRLQGVPLVRDLRAIDAAATGDGLALSIAGAATHEA